MMKPNYPGYGFFHLLRQRNFSQVLIQLEMKKTGEKGFIFGEKA
jgi:hypothetical protein